MVQSAEKKIILDLTTNNTFAAQSVAVLEKDIINFSNAEIPVAPKANCSKILSKVTENLKSKTLFPKADTKDASLSKNCWSQPTDLL